MSCGVLKEVKQLGEKDTNILMRLSFEIQGYEALIRTFTVRDIEWNIDEERYNDLLKKRDALVATFQTLLKRLCGPNFTGLYEIDYGTGEIRWG